MIIKELNSSLSIHEMFEIFLDGDYCFLLESSGDIKSLARYSFLGGNPSLIFKSKGEKIEIEQAGNITKITGNPFNELELLMNKFRFRQESAISPLTGGAVGYFGYDLARFLETLPSKSIDDLKLPDAYFMFIDTMIVFDHWENKKYILSVTKPSKNLKERKKREESAQKSLAFLEKKIRLREKRKANRKIHTGYNGEIKISPMISKEEYIEMIKRVKEYIRAGDVYEVNLSHRLEAELENDPWKIYKKIISFNPAPFSAYMKFGDLKIISSSPERFLNVKGTAAESRPIKGTRPRGKTPGEDKALKNELSLSEKERAENLMIVDLVRNDLGRVCKFGSVEVAELMAIEPYSRVFQMVSTIRGELDGDKNNFDCIKACFPGGSMTGAPKIRAMEIIEELEPVKRGIYSGSLGYLSFSGETDFNIIIRTLIASKGKMYLQVGGAIVADSDPEAEYEETWHKAMSVLGGIGGEVSYKL